MAAARKEAAVGGAAKAVLKVVARLHPVDALDLLEPVFAATKPGLRRRVLLAARIVLMRKALVSPVRATVVPDAPLPDAAEAVAPSPPPPPPPKPLATGKIMAINLDDLSSMFAPPEAAEPEGSAGPDAGAASAAFTPLDWADTAIPAGGAPDTAPAVEDGADGAAPDAAEPAKTARGRKRGAVVAIKGGAGAAGGADELLAALSAADGDGDATAGDAAALFAAMDADAPQDAGGRAVGAGEASALFAALDGDGADAAAGADGRGGAAVADAAALFAAMDADAPQDAGGRAVGAGDVSALFAALDGDGADAAAGADGRGGAAVADAAAMFAAMDADAPQDAGGRAVGAGDVSALFAALDGIEEAEVIATEPPRVGAAGLGDVSALFAAMDDDDRPDPPDAGT